MILGFELKNKTLDVRISIIANDPHAAAEYTEIHNPVTDNFGLFTIVIGQGNYVNGSADDFSEISPALFNKSILSF